MINFKAASVKSTVEIVRAYDVLRAFTLHYGLQRNAAKALGVSPGYVSDLLSGRRDFSEAMLAKLGLRRIVVREKQIVVKTR